MPKKGKEEKDGVLRPSREDWARLAGPEPVPPGKGKQQEAPLPSSDAKPGGGKRKPKSGSIEGLVETGTSQPHQLQQTAATPPYAQQPIAKPYLDPLKNDLTDYFSRVLSHMVERGNVELPANIFAMRNTRNKSLDRVIQVHARALAETVGLEGFTIRNYSHEVDRDKFLLVTTRIGYEVRSTLESIEVKADALTAYVTALLGPNATASILHSLRTTLAGNASAKISELPNLFPWERALDFLRAFDGQVEVPSPFESPYFLVMEVMPPAYREKMANVLFDARHAGFRLVPSSGFFPQGTYYVDNKAGAESSHHENLEDHISSSYRRALNRLASITNLKDAQELYAAFNVASEELLTRIK